MPPLWANLLILWTQKGRSAISRVIAGLKRSMTTEQEAGRYSILLGMTYCCQQLPFSAPIQWRSPGQNQLGLLTYKTFHISSVFPCLWSSPNISVLVYNHLFYTNTEIVIAGFSYMENKMDLLQQLSNCINSCSAMIWSFLWQNKLNMNQFLHLECRFWLPVTSCKDLLATHLYAIVSLYLSQKTNPRCSKTYIVCPQTLFQRWHKLQGHWRSPTLSTSSARYDPLLDAQCPNVP